MENSAKRQIYKFLSLEDFQIVEMTLLHKYVMDMIFRFQNTQHKSVKTLARLVHL